MSFIPSTIKSAAQHRSVMRLVNLSLAALFAVSLLTTLAVDTTPVEAAVKRTCKSPNNGKVHTLSKDDFQTASIAVNGSTATATFKFPGYCEGQNVPVTLVSYKSPNTPDNMPFSKQIYFSSVSRSYNQPRNDAQLSVQIPNCRFQVDLVLGDASDVIRQFSDGHGSANTYSGQGRMITATGGNLGVPCPEIDPPAPAPAPAPVAPTAVPTQQCVNNSCNTTTITQVNTNETTISNSPNTTVSNQQGNAAAVSNGAPATATVTQTQTTPTPAPVTPAVATTTNTGKLPDTGAGFIAPFAFGATFMSSMLLSYRSRFTDMLAGIIAKM